jgi:hypothetical protein
VALSLLQLIESMEGLSILSAFAMASLISSFFYIGYISFSVNSDPPYEREIKLFDFYGVPYFFVIALYVLEGNALTLDIYQ